MRIVLFVLLLGLAPERPLEWWVARDEAAAAAREELKAKLLLDSLPSPPKEWLAAKRKAYERDVAEIAPLVPHLRERLTGDTVIAADLRAFLDRPDAAERLYRRFLRPHLNRGPVSRALGGVIAPRDDGKFHIPANLRASAARLLAACEARDGDLASIRQALLAAHSKTGVEEIRESGRAVARQLAAGDELTEKWRTRLDGEGVLVLASLAKEPARPNLGKVLLDRTRFGHCLVRGDDGKYTINRHTYFELDALLGELTADPGPAAAHPIRVEMAELRAKGRDLRMVPKDEPGEARLAAIRRELTAENSAVTLDLGALPCETGDLDLFRSQVFYNPRTGAGQYWYTVEFADHPIARLFGTFGWTAKTTGSVEEFHAKLDARMPYLRSLAATHDKLIILINTMPPWLSASDDPGQFEGERRSNREAHPPKDWETWRKMIRGMVTRLKRIEGVEWYYEFWNEPDLQYWQGDLPSVLKLFAETVKTIKAADPRAKVGGCAPNQWDGRLRRAKDADPVNLELIRHVGKEKLPFDFVSWHVFGRPIAAIAEAKEAYTKALVAAGFRRLPEFLVTEWSVPYRGTAYAPSNMADRMVGFYEARVDAQTIACWEEFHAKPHPKHFPPWGMLTQQGHRKPSYYVHRFFDRIARGSEGVAVVKREDGWRVVVSKKAGGVYDLILWRPGIEPRFQAALDALKKGGFTNEHGRPYTSYDRLERAILDQKPVPEGLQAAFAAAKKALLAHPVQTPRLLLTIEDAQSVEVRFAESVRMERRIRKPVVLGNRITLPLVPYEVLRLTLRATPEED